MYIFEFLFLVIDLMIREDILSAILFGIILLLLFDRFNTRLRMEDLKKSEEYYKKLAEEYKDLLNNQISPFGLACMATCSIGLGMTLLSYFLFILFFFFSQPANVEEMVLVYKGLLFPEHKHYLLVWVNGRWQEY